MAGCQVFLFVLFELVFVPLFLVFVLFCLSFFFWGGGLVPFAPHLRCSSWFLGPCDEAPGAGGHPRGRRLRGLHRALPGPVFRSGFRWAFLGGFGSPRSSEVPLLTLCWVGRGASLVTWTPKTGPLFFLPLYPLIIFGVKGMKKGSFGGPGKETNQKYIYRWYQLILTSQIWRT